MVRNPTESERDSGGKVNAVPVTKPNIFWPGPESAFTFAPESFPQAAKTVLDVKHVSLLLFETRGSRFVG